MKHICFRKKIGFFNPFIFLLLVSYKYDTDDDKSVGEMEKTPP